MASVKAKSLRRWAACPHTGEGRCGRGGAHLPSQYWEVESGKSEVQGQGQPWLGYNLSKKEGKKEKRKKPKEDINKEITKKIMVV